MYSTRMRYETHQIHTGTLHKENFFDDPFVGIGIKDVPEHPDYPEHSHDFTELVVVYEGNGINVVDGFEYPLVAGDVFVLNPGQVHAYKDTKHLHLSNVLFDAEIIGLQTLDMAHLPGFHALFRLEPTLRKKNFNSRLHLRDKELMKARAVSVDIYP
jgi:mannose-6-phosphate isomerase-like protein (cupin superfamily)